MVPPGELICTMTALALDFASFFERFDAILIVADQAR